MHVSRFWDRFNYASRPNDWDHSGSENLLKALFTFIYFCYLFILFMSPAASSVS